MSINLLGNNIEDIYRYNYGCGVGIISKSANDGNSEKEQDKSISENKAQIEANKKSLEENEKRDDEQQRQLDANDAVDASQQKQIDENRSRLDENFANDAKQQYAIEKNTSIIQRINEEMPTLEVQGTAMIIGKKKDTQ